MFSFSGNTALADQLVIDLAANPASSVSEINYRLSESGRRVSRQAIYQALSQLKEADVVVGEGKKYSLKLTWLIRLVAFSQSAERTYLSSATYEQVLPRPGESRLWTFPSLQQMDPFGAHTQLAVLSRAREQTMYGWVPHPWYDLIHNAQEENFVDSVRVLGKTLAFFFPGGTNLDREVVASYSPDVYSPQMSRNVLRPVEVYEYVIDSFVIEVRIPTETALEIDQLFLTTGRRAEIDMDAVFTVVSRQRGAVTLRLSNDAEAASLIREEYRRAVVSPSSSDSSR